MNTTTSKLPSIATLGPFIALLVACIFFASQSDRFLSTQNFSLILQQVMVVGVIAIGQTLVILTAGIDLSCGMVMALGSIVMTKFAADYGLSAPAAIACGIAATAAFGLVNGLLVTRIKLPPFIVTLGTLNIAFACTQLYSHAQTVTNIPEGMNLLGNTFKFGDTQIAYGALLMLALYAGVWIWLRETAAGRHVYAVGNSPEATRLTGISTEKVLLGVYVLAGVFYGIAAMLSVARTGAGDPNGGQTENLDAIT
ncbi:MAG: ABC transporter permease, partial [Rhodoferax sp.]|nr:ABC transporter permease [Rhodoferax sp.]